MEGKWDEESGQGKHDLMGSWMAVLAVIKGKNRGHGLRILTCTGSTSNCDAYMPRNGSTACCTYGHRSWETVMMSTW